MYQALVFPAYAGVNLAYLAEREALPRIPRVCGGEPVVKEFRKIDFEYSPRMRG